ncbi:MAG: hypothetical protein ACE5JL_16250, partial [Dehalococcoidia bacterium]
MGGPGSGRWGEHIKTSVEECLELDATRLARDGVIGRGETSGCLVWTNASGELAFSVGYTVEPTCDDEP